MKFSTKPALQGQPEASALYLVLTSCTWAPPSPGGRWAGEGCPGCLWTQPRSLFACTGQLWPCSAEGRHRGPRVFCPMWSEPQGPACRVTDGVTANTCGHLQSTYCVQDTGMFVKLVDGAQQTGRGMQVFPRLTKHSVLRGRWNLPCSGKGSRQLTQKTEDKRSKRPGTRESLFLARLGVQTPRAGDLAGACEEGGRSLVSGRGLVVPQAPARLQTTDPVQAPTSTRRAGVPRQVRARQRSVCVPPLHPHLCHSHGPRGCGPPWSRALVRHAAGGRPCVMASACGGRSWGPGLRGLGVWARCSPGGSVFGEGAGRAAEPFFLSRTWAGTPGPWLPPERPCEVGLACRGEEGAM